MRAFTLSAALALLIPLPSLAATPAPNRQPAKPPAQLWGKYPLGSQKLEQLSTPKPTPRPRARAPAQRPPTITGGDTGGTSFPLWAVLLAALAMSCVLGLAGESLVGRARRLVRPPRRYQSSFREGPAVRTDDPQAPPPPPTAEPVEDDGALSAAVEQLRQAAALEYEDPKLHAGIEAITVSGGWRPLALETVLSSWDKPAVTTLARPQGPRRALLSTMSNWGHSPIAALARRSAPPSIPTEAGVRNVAKMIEADLPRAGSLGVGDQVGAILAAAEEDAERMRREVHEEAAAIRHQTEKALAAGTTELTKVIERIKSKAVTDARSLREAAEQYALEHLQSANERAAMVVARAEAKAQARRASAEEAAQFVDEACRRQAALKEAADALDDHLRAGVEERLHAARQGLENLTSGLQEILGKKPTDAEVDEKTETWQKAG